jgi:hypothetical protein
MASFRQYNIQLLPSNDLVPEEVGIEGYRSLFEQLSYGVKERRQKRELLPYSFELIHDTYICPFEVGTEGSYGQGCFIRFHKAETVQDLYTNEELFTATDGSAPVSNSFRLRFIFDYAMHTLAIEEQGGKLPAPLKFESVLLHFLNPIAKSHFSGYELTVNLVTDEKSLEQVLREAVGYYSVDIHMTFQNGQGTNACVNELKEKLVHRIELKTSAARGSLMTELTEYAQALLQHVNKLGQTTISYAKKISDTVTRREQYKSKNFPKRFQIRQSHDELDDEFLERAANVLRNPGSKRNRRSKGAKKVK